MCYTKKKIHLCLGAGFTRKDFNDMRTAICEDEKIFADDLKERVLVFFKMRDESIDFDFFTDGSQLLASLRSGARYDIIFLDIQLENSDGMDTAAELRKIDRTVPVVFVTGLEDRAADGYSVNAFDYIVKASVGEKLDKVLMRFMERRNEKTIAVENLQGDLAVIALNDILYTESDGRHSVIHTMNGEIKTALSISRISAMLPEGEFIEIYKSIYVRTLQIKNISTDRLELSDGTVLPLSRRRKKAVLSAVMRQVRNS